MTDERFGQAKPDLRNAWSTSSEKYVGYGHYGQPISHVDCLLFKGQN